MDRRIYQIAPTFINGLGCRGYRQLLEIYPDPEAVFNLSHKELVELFTTHTNIIGSIESGECLHRAQKELEFIDRYHIRVLFCQNEDYPQRLNRKECSDTPPVLYLRGNYTPNQPRTVAIVGTRRASDYGKEITHQIVSEMHEDGITIVSGLAYGIDTAAHKNAVECGLDTVGVLGHGLDHIYPAQNRELAKKMMEQGALMTEYPSETAVTPGNFPARNRIIAALADAVIVVEAAEKGGALITAGIANGYQRDVFAVPGRLSDRYSVGCNNLIATNKANILRNAKDLFEQMGWQMKGCQSIGRQQELFVMPQGDTLAISELLQREEGLTLDEISERMGLSMPKVAALLLDMELDGFVKCLPGKRYYVAKFQN